MRRSMRNIYKKFPPPQIPIFFHYAHLLLPSRSKRKIQMCARVSTHASTHTKRINMKQFNMDLNKTTGGGDKRELTEEDIHQGLEYVCFSKINRGTWNKRLDRICKIASVVLCFVEGQDLTEIQKSGTTWKNNVVLLLYYFEAGLISPWRDLSFAIRHKNIYYSHEFSKNKNNKTKIFPYHSAFNFYES